MAKRLTNIESIRVESKSRKWKTTTMPQWPGNCPTFMANNFSFPFSSLSLFGLLNLSLIFILFAIAVWQVFLFSFIFFLCLIDNAARKLLKKEKPVCQNESQWSSLSLPLSLSLFVCLSRSLCFLSCWVKISRWGRRLLRCSSVRLIEKCSISCGCYKKKKKKTQKHRALYSCVFQTHLNCINPKKKIVDIFASSLHIDPSMQRAFNAIPNIPKTEQTLFIFNCMCHRLEAAHHHIRTHPLTHTHSPCAMMIQFGCSSSTRNGLKCAQVEYFKLLVSVLGWLYAYFDW